MKQELENLKEIVRDAGRIIEGYFGQNLDIEEKDTCADFRTKADQETDDFLVEKIVKLFPYYNIFSEENGKIDKGSEYTFIVDPLDGSNNFVLGIPYFSISIALVKNDETIFSLVYNPIIKDFFYAFKKEGAYLNNKKIHVSSEDDVKRITVAYMCGYVNDKNYWAEIIKKLNEKDTKRILLNWSPALDFCLLASGKIESIINHKTEIYDYSAGKLIAEEAGAICTDFSGGKTADKENTFVISNNKHIHKEILSVL